MIQYNDFSSDAWVMLFKRISLLKCILVSGFEEEFMDICLYLVVCGLRNQLLRRNLLDTVNLHGLECHGKGEEEKNKQTRM